MGNADSIPVVSQTKSLVQAISGDAEGALRTQENFSRQCPVVAQTRSLVEVASGDEAAALETQKQFVKGVSDFADRTPGVGHIKGGIHYACGDREGGDKAMMDATRGILVPPLLATAFNGDSDQDYSHFSDEVLNGSRIAVEFNGVQLSEWVKELDDYLAVMCCDVMEALNRKKRARGDFLQWEDVVSAVSSCSCVINVGSCKHIDDEYTFDEVNFFKFDGSPDDVRTQKIISWVKNLMIRQGEQSITDNAEIFGPQILNRLARIASQSGATVRDHVSLMGASERQKERVMEFSVIRFPFKKNSKIKVFRAVLLAWFKCTRVLFGQHDESGFEFTYDSYEFKPNTHAIDKRYASEAKAKLSQPGAFDF